MAIGIHCPHCGAGLRTKGERPGLKLRCMRCGTKFLAATGEILERGSLPEQDTAVSGTCPQCGGAFSCRPALVGRQVRCARCGVTFVPGEARPPRPAASGTEPPSGAVLGARLAMSSPEAHREQVATLALPGTPRAEPVPAAPPAPDRAPSARRPRPVALATPATVVLFLGVLAAAVAFLAMVGLLAAS